MSSPKAAQAPPILQLNSARGWGGGETLVWQLCVGLRERGYQVSGVARPGSPLAQRLQQSGVPTFLCAPRSAVDLRGLLRLAAAVRRTRAGVLHAHAGRDYVPAMLAGRLTGCKVVLHRHIPMPLKPTTCSLALRWAHAICAPSRFIGDVLVKQDLIPADRVHVIPLLPDLRLFSQVTPEDAARVRSELGAHGRPLIVSVGHLYRSKGHEDLIRAVGLLRQQGADPVLAIAGEGNDRAYFEALIAECDLQECVRLLGLRSDVPALLQACDVFALLSWEEAMGSAIIEAMFVGKPVVATNAGGIPEFVADGQTGLLVPVHAPEAAAKAIARVLADGALASALAAAGHEAACSRFTLDVSLDRLTGLYRQVVGG